GGAAGYTHGSLTGAWKRLGYQLQPASLWEVLWCAGDRHPADSTVYPARRKTPHNLQPAQKIPAGPETTAHCLRSGWCGDGPAAIAAAPPVFPAHREN